jgi:hypothetical protein
MIPYFEPAVQDLPVDSGVTLTGIAKILALIGTLFAVLNAPAGISQLIGSDLSVSSALQSLQTTMIGSSLLGAAGRILGGTAKDAGALAAYGGGRLLGGSSIGKQMEKMANGAAGGLSPLVSDRAAFGGIQGGIESLMSSSSPGLMDFAAGFAANGLPNIAKPISELNASSGSMRDIISNPNYSGFEKFSRMGMKVTGWGASRAYAAASNRVSSIGRRDMRSYRNPMNPMTMMNAVNPQNGGEQS